MILRTRAFLLGMWEFRLCSTQGYEDYELLLAYDRGREWAHRLTLRLFDN